MIHALPQRARNYYFRGLGNLGDSFRESFGKDILDDMTAASGSTWLSLHDNRNVNGRVLFLAGMHLLCRELSRADDWLSSEFRIHVKDKVEPFFKLVNCPEDALESRVNELKQLYGTGEKDVATKEFDSLRSTYKNVSRRSYHCAYISLRPEWRTFLQQEPATFFQKIKDTLLSENYKEHLLPKLIDLAEQSTAMPFCAQISALADKLTILAHLGSISMTEIEHIVQVLLESATSTGLLRNTLIDPKPEVRLKNQISIP